MIYSPLLSHITQLTFSQILRMEKENSSHRLSALSTVDRITIERVALMDSIAEKQQALLVAADTSSKTRLQAAQELLNHRQLAEKVSHYIISVHFYNVIHDGITLCMRSEGPIHDSVGCNSTYISNSKLIILLGYVPSFSYSHYSLTPTATLYLDLGG